MTETRKLAAILVADVVGYSRLAGADEERTLARLRGLRSDLIDPAVAAHHGRIVKRTGDGSVIEFRSVVDAVRCAIEVQQGLIDRNAGVPEDRRIQFRVGIHIGDVVEESDGDLMGDGVNIAARLEGVAKPGAICLSEDAYRQVKGRLDLAVTDLGPTQLKNIAEPIRVYSLEVGVPAQAKTAAAAKPSGQDKRLAATLAGAALLLALAAGGWYWLAANRPGAVSTASSPPAASQPSEAKHLSIVVLPFTNLSGDPAQDYFADGVTENLTTDLSRIRNSFVVARNTAFTYKGKNVDAKEIGKERGVRYVLEGSAQRDGNRVRVNAQLIDTQSGAHLWADRFDEDVADLFKLQDQVVARLGNALGFELVRAEAEKSGPSGNPDALDLAMRGWATMWRSYPQQPKEKRDSHYAALALFDQALKANPNEAEALAGEAFTRLALFIFAEAPADPDLDAKIIDPADRAIALAPDDMRAYVAKSFYLAITGRASEALRTADAGLAINPNSAPLLDARTLAETVLGRFEQAKADVQQAIRLSPRDPEIPNRRMNLGLAQLGLGQFDAAEAEFQQAIDSGDHSFIPYVNLTAAYALQGKMGEAKSALEQARRLNPDLTIKWLMGHAPNIPPLFEGLRKAGLAEDAPPEPARLSIVVLPFANLSGDPGQDYLVDALTDELTTSLAHIPGSFVIARNTAMTFKDKPVDVKAIGKDLGARYVLEGSVQPSGDRTRVNAQLIDAESGAHLWAEQFDTPRADLLQTQDAIVTHLANAMAFQLTQAEAARLKRTPAANRDAEDLALQCAAGQWKAGSIGKEADRTFALCEQALAIDPNNVRALMLSGFKFLARTQAGVSSDPKGDLERADELASKALALDPDWTAINQLKGDILRDQGHNEEAVAEHERALALDPSNVSAATSLGFDYGMHGEFDKSIEYIDKAIRESPYDPLLVHLYGGKAWANFGLKNYDQAIEWARQAIAVNPNYVHYIHATLVAALALAGHDAEARDALKRYLALPSTGPLKTIAALKAYYSAQGGGPARVEANERLYDGLRKAGMAEE